MSFSSSRTLLIYKISIDAKGVSINLKERSSALSIAPVFATRNTSADLLIVTPGHTLCLLTRGCERLDLKTSEGSKVPHDPRKEPHVVKPARFIQVKDSAYAAVTLVTEHNTTYRAFIDFHSRDRLTALCVNTMERVLLSQDFLNFFRKYLFFREAYPCVSEEFDAFKSGFSATFAPSDDTEPGLAESRDYWDQLTFQISTTSLHSERTLAHLNFPTNKTRAPRSRNNPNDKILRVLASLGAVAEGAKLSLRFRSDALKLGAFIQSLPIAQSPFWIDYWNRRLPSVYGGSAIPSRGWSSLQREPRLY